VNNRHLVLVRHAKSSWSDPGRADADRALNDRGLRDAPRMGARIHARGPQPQRILSSHARRALHTAQLIADACGYPRADIDIVDEIYEASPATLLTIVRALPARLFRVLLVGHNPGLTELANQLCPQARIENIPTGGVLYLDFAARDWTSIGDEPPVDWEFDYPKRDSG
jgi:phosphohistidine phosphatase